MLISYHIYLQNLPKALVSKRAALLLGELPYQRQPGPTTHPAAWRPAKWMMCAGPSASTRGECFGWGAITAEKSWVYEA